MSQLPPVDARKFKIFGLSFALCFWLAIIAGIAYWLLNGTN